MPTFLLIHKHSPESCPTYNEKTRKVTLELVNKLEGLLKKHGIKMVGCWHVPSEHLIFEVYDAPSLETFQKLSMEPEIAAWGSFNTFEVKLAVSSEETIKMLKQAK